MGRVKQALGKARNQRCDYSIYQNADGENRAIAAPDADDARHEQGKIFSLEEPHGKREQP